LTDLFRVFHQAAFPAIGPLETIGLIVAKTKAQKSDDSDSFFKKSSKFN
jgi:hypothetical protein